MICHTDTELGRDSSSIISGLTAPSMVVNGVVLDDLSNAEEALLETLQAQLPKLQRAVYLGEVSEGTNILGS